MSETPRVLAVVPHELMRVLTGAEMNVSTLDHEEITLRLATPEELVEMNRHARAELSAQMGRPMGVELTLERARTLTGPINL